MEEILDITLMDHGLMSVHSFIQRRSLFKKTRLSEQPSHKLNQLLGPVKIHSYFVDPEFYENELPVISMAGDPDDFWMKTREFMSKILG